MPLILAIEPDRRQAHELTAMVRGHLRANLVLADTAEKALADLGARVPDLILTSALLSAKDETILAERLRTLDIAAAHVQTLTIPVLETPMRVSTSRTGIFALLPERVSSPAAPDGCDPAVFAEQCAAYLERAATERGPVVRTAAVDSVPPLDEPDEPEAPAEETIAAMEAAPLEAPVSEPPPPPPAAEAIDDSIEIDLSGMLDEKVFQQLSEAIETVSRDSAQAAPEKTIGEAWTPSSLGSAAVWPAMDFASSAQQGHASSSTSSRSASKRFPARKPLQDEWGFFDPAQCGFSALLAKLDEITHLPSPAGSPERQNRTSGA